jgi:neutral trehalase
LRKQKYRRSLLVNQQRENNEANSAETNKTTSANNEDADINETIPRRNSHSSTYPSSLTNTDKFTSTESYSQLDNDYKTKDNVSSLVDDKHESNMNPMSGSSSSDVTENANIITEKEKEEILKFIINEVDLFGCTALHYACASPHVRVRQ